MAENKKIGLVLSGGGARGAAHVGVLKALNEYGIFPTHLAGASAGALIAALYCSGLSPDKMMTLVKHDSFKKIFKMSILHLELPELKYLKTFLREHVQVENIEDLELPLFISATNINEGKTEILRSGSLVDSVAASCAIPLFFKPVTIEGKLFVDGGVLNNLPIEPLLATCDEIIGVNVCPHEYKTPVTGRAQIAERIFQMSIWGNMAHRINQCDLMIDIKPAFLYSMFDLTSAEALFNTGYESAIEQLYPIRKELQEYQSGGSIF